MKFWVDYGSFLTYNPVRMQGIRFNHMALQPRPPHTHLSPVTESLGFPQRC